MCVAGGEDHQRGGRVKHGGGRADARFGLPAKLARATNEPGDQGRLGEIAKVEVVRPSPVLGLVYDEVDTRGGDAAVPASVLGEVIAVDDSSDDRTGAKIKALFPRYPALRYIRHGERAG